MQNDFEGIDGDLLAELQQALRLEDIRSKPLDPTIPHILLNNSAERILGPKDARNLRRQRRRLYREWLRELRATKHRVQCVRIRSGSVPFATVFRFEANCRWAMAKLRWIGWLHFSGIT